MLKALELYGFKSFADKTRFEFPSGITVVVGPNGSGKSNIVDAIKWVLGEQSAKSLRGKDMADVIFKGSGQSGRKPMNAAEATLVFENADRRLPIDAPEVHITRRVYRSGEGEYLINRQPARLKDIRDMFRGTGVGGDAYSLIEQGKVDRLLQASAKDRRAMFEEAAGISRFKAKKVEAQRRLERVDQNLLRLSDIVEEVENRLKAVRSQAGKARRYREYSERLQELRTQIARVDWRRLSKRLEELEGELAGIVDQIGTADSQSERLEAQQLELEAAGLAATEELRSAESRVASTRQQIAQQQGIIGHERTRAAELDEESKLHQRNLLAMSDRAGDVRARLKATQQEATGAQAAHQAAASGLQRRETQLVEIAERHEATRHEVESRRQQYVAELQAAAALASQVEAGETQLAGVQQSVLNFERQLVQLTAEETRVADQLAAATEKEQALAQQLAAHADQVDIVDGELTENRNLHASRADDLAQLHSRRQGVAERAGILEEFERTLEGLGAGVKQVLARAGIRSQEPGTRNQEPGAKSQEPGTRNQEAGARSQEPPVGQTPEFPIRNPKSKIQNSTPWSLVRGLVADFLHVGVEHAAAIDAALGDAAHQVVVDGTSDEALALVAASKDVSSRVVAVALRDPEPGASAIPLKESEPAGINSVSGTALAAGDAGLGSRIRAPGFSAGLELTAEMVAGAQVVARADKLIECPAEYQPLLARLLQTTFVVRTLADALRVRATAPQGARFVTLDGELVDEHGAIAFGPRHSATSLVSRRAQLRAARIDLAVLDQQIADAHRETLHLKREIERHEQALKTLAESGKGLDQQIAVERVAVQSLTERRERCQRQRHEVERSLGEAGQRCQALDAGLKQSSRELAGAQAAAEARQSAIAAQERALALSESERQAAAGEVTSAKVELARCEQRLESLRLRLTQFEDDRRERERAIAQVRQQLRQSQERLENSDLLALAASAQIASLALVVEALGCRLAALAAARQAAQAQRSQTADELTTLRRRALALREQEHQLQLSAEQVRHQRQTLADRLREDYAIELADLQQEPTAEEAQERVAVEAEIESLRRKINQIGAVNLEALNELDDLEVRFGVLSGQYKDLTDAKQALERIIHKINGDSRRLFLETLEAIRVNFQALYRRAFGGGKADIVLEEGVDVLECGVEIIATPPGKPSFNNSLLSGGEKALTAVALLLAIFQFRPSPFCVLDEVDAPFDEANIGRFIDVLKDFLSWTRFVIVTHSKKTMTAATTLYGVTMQESGVSKRVSVRFDDVTDEGHIRREALDRSDPLEGSDQRGVA